MANEMGHGRVLVERLALGLALRVVVYQWWSWRSHVIDEHVFSSPSLSLHAMAECRYRLVEGIGRGEACRAPLLAAYALGRVGSAGSAAACAFASVGDAWASVVLDRLQVSERRSATSCYFLNPVVAAVAATGSSLSWLVACHVGAAVLAREGRVLAAGAVWAVAASCETSSALVALPGVALLAVASRAGSPRRVPALRATAGATAVFCVGAGAALALGALATDALVAASPATAYATGAETDSLADAARALLAVDARARQPLDGLDGLAARPPGPLSTFLSRTTYAPEPNAGPTWYFSLVVFGRFLPLFRAVFFCVERTWFNHTSME